MKIWIDIQKNLTEDELIIKCSEITPLIQEIQKYAAERSVESLGLTFYQDNEEFFFPLDDVLFFETSAEKVHAHTKNEVYQTKYRLYELLKVLPRNFVRISKSGIINTAHIYSIQKNITSSSLVRFKNSHKQVYISRAYYKEVRARITERRYT